MTSSEVIISAGIRGAVTNKVKVKGCRLFSEQRSNKATMDEDALRKAVKIHVVNRV